jgi:hypothetical protein
VGQDLADLVDVHDGRVGSDPCKRTHSQKIRGSKRKMGRNEERGPTLLDGELLLRVVAGCRAARNETLPGRREGRPTGEGDAAVAGRRGRERGAAGGSGHGHGGGGLHRRRGVEAEVGIVDWDAVCGLAMGWQWTVRASNRGWRRYERGTGFSALEAPHRPASVLDAAAIWFGLVWNGDLILATNNFYLLFRKF